MQLLFTALIILFMLTLTSIPTFAQSDPIVNVGSDSNSIYFHWRNIPTENDRYDIFVIKDGVTSKVTTVTSTSGAVSHSYTSSHYDQLSNADKIGVAGIIGGVTGTTVFGDVPKSVTPVTLTPPTLVAGEITSNSIELTWTTQLGATGYELFRDGTSIGDTMGLTFTDTDLTPDTAYIYTITSTDGTNTSALSTPLTVSTTSTPVTLTPPTLVVNLVTHRQIILAWDASPGATSYTIHVSAVNEMYSLPTSPLAITFAALTPNTEYTYTITSTDGTTTSALSAPLRVTTSASPVTDLSFDYNANGTTEVTFISSIAGDYIIRYIAVINNDESSVEPVPVTVSASQINNPVTNTLLTLPGYAGDVSIAVNFVSYVRDTIDVPPAPPTLRVGEITATSVEITWDKSRGATGYVIYEGSTRFTTSDLSYTHTGLTPETAYSYTAESTDGIVTSALSAPLPVTTPPLTVEPLTFTYNPDGSTEVSFTPSAPAEYIINYAIASDESTVEPVPVTISATQINNIVTNTLLTSHGYSGIVTVSFDGTEYDRGIIAVPPAPPALVAGDITKNSIEITWDAPRSATEYLIYENSILIDTIPDTTFTHSGLSIETEYTYTVESRYDGLKSTLSAPLTLSTDPPSLRSISLDYNIGNTLVSFIPLEFGEFTINYITAGDETAVDSVPITITPEQVGDSTTVTLLTDFGYTGEVTASFDGVDYASASAEVPPAAPTLSMGDTTATSITLSWNEPRGAIEYELFRGDTSIETTASLTFTDTDLTPDTAYTYTITSTDGTTTSAPSTELTASTTQLTVGSLVFDYNDSGHTEVSFTPSDTGDYTLSYDPSPGEERIRSVTITALQANVSTSTTLETSFGYSGTVTISFGDIAYASNTLSVPPAPPVLSVGEITVTGAEISWTAPLGAVSYDLFRDGTSITKPTELTFTDTGLTPETTYTYTIKSINDNSQSSTLSTGLEVITLAEPFVTAVRQDDNSIKLTWENIPSDTNSYSIHIIESGSTDTVLLTRQSTTGTYTFFSNSDFALTRAEFDRVNNAERIGVSSTVLDVRGDVVYAPIPTKITSITNLSFTYNDDGHTNVLFIPKIAGAYTIDYERATGESPVLSTSVVILTADLNGVTTVPLLTSHGYSGEVTVSFSGTPSVSKVVKVPPTTLVPFVNAERLDDNSLKVSWGNIPSHGNYAIIIPNIDDNTPVRVHLTAFSPFIFNDEHAQFDQINNTEKIGVQGFIGGEAGTPEYAPVPALNADNKKGNSDEWKTKPTFGIDWTSQAQIVDTGFVFNDIPLTITDNWHTDFNLTSGIVGENNIIHIKGYAPNDFKLITLSLGIPEVGKKYDAESHIILNLNRNYTAPSDYEIMDIFHEQKENLVNENMTSASLSKVKCMPTNNAERCLDVEIAFTIMATLEHDVLAISAVDSKFRENVTFINRGVTFIGDSLLPAETYTLRISPNNQYPDGIVELTRQDRLSQIWEDSDGYLWSQNEYDSFLQITVPDIEERVDPETSILTRNHSAFDDLVTDERDKALIIFNSSAITK